MLTHQPSRDPSTVANRIRPKNASSAKVLTMNRYLRGPDVLAQLD
jgi:hypothetical protein